MKLYMDIITVQLIELSVILFTMSLLLKEKIIKSKWKICLSIVIFLNSFLLVKVIGNRSEALVGLVVQIICINILFKAKILMKNSIFAATYCGIGLFSGMLKESISYLSGEPSESVTSSVTYSFIIYLFLFVMIYTISYIFKNKNSQIVGILKNTSLSDMLLFCLTTIIWSLGIAYFGAWRENLINPLWNKAMVISIALIYIICMLVVVGFIWKNMISKKYKNENMIKNEIIDLREKYYKKLIENNDEVRQFRHDLKAHMICLKKLANDGKYNEFNCYLNEVESNINIFYNKVNVGNEISNIILNEFYEEAVNNKIEFECSGKFRGNILISSYELCVLFYNLVKNAIEECLHIEISKRKIFLMVKSYKESVVIQISNSVSKPIDIDMIEKNGTTKEDKRNHGYGMRNIKRIVKKYNGVVKYKNSDDKFIVEMILNNVYDIDEYEKK